MLPNVRDKLSPLEVQMTYAINPSSSEANKMDDSDDLLPIIDPRQNLRALTDAASILKDCGLDNICIPNLKVAYNVSLIGKDKPNPVWFNMTNDKYLIGRWVVK